MSDAVSAITKQLVKKQQVDDMVERERASCGRLLNFRRRNRRRLGWSKNGLVSRRGRDLLLQRTPYAQLVRCTVY